MRKPRLRPLVASTAMILVGIGGLWLLGAGLREIVVIAAAGAVLVPLQVWLTGRLWRDDGE